MHTPLLEKRIISVLGEVPGVRKSLHSLEYNFLKSFIVGAIHEILPEDPVHPRFLRFTVEGEHGVITAVFEFDTTESAREWRRDFSGKR